MLQNAYFIAKISADTAENEQHFAGILPIGRRGPKRSAEATTRLMRQDSSAGTLEQRGEQGEWQVVRLFSKLEASVQ